MPRQEVLGVTGCEYSKRLVEQGTAFLEKVGARELLEGLRRSIESDHPEARIVDPYLTEYGSVQTMLQWDFSRVRGKMGIKEKIPLESVPFALRDRYTCRHVSVTVLPLTGEVAICGRRATIFSEPEFGDTAGLNEATQEAFRSEAIMVGGLF